jgi:hypothetical protein
VSCGVSGEKYKYDKSCVVAAKWRCVDSRLSVVCLDSALNYFEVVGRMDLSELKWLKNVRPDQGWAYDKPNEMPIPEAKIFRLHWRNQDDKANAQQPLKGDLIALVQSARVTHTNVNGIDDR